jgi:hypothetical protein
MLNLKEIFVAWVTAANPTEEERNLAQARFEVCKGCKYKREVIAKKSWALLCGKCGCPIQGKVFSKTVNPCEMGYWKEVDKSFGLKTDEKTDNTVI